MDSSMKKGSKPPNNPRLMLLAACGKAIIDDSDKLVSLVDIIQELTISASEAPKPGQRGVGPIPWQVFTMWKRAGDKPGHFVQTTELIDPAGKALFRNDMEFATTSSSYRIRLRFQAFPITTAGEYTVKVYVRPKENKRKPRTTAGCYSIDVIFSDEMPRS